MIVLFIKAYCLYTFFEFLGEVKTWCINFILLVSHLEMRFPYCQMHSSSSNSTSWLSLSHHLSAPTLWCISVTHLCRHWLGLIHLLIWIFVCDCLFVRAQSFPEKSKHKLNPKINKRIHQNLLFLFDCNI